jgi:sugar phosphate isomerase/epimerase
MIAGVKASPISRRGFLQTSAAFGLAVGVTKVLPGAEPAAGKSKVIVGAHPWVYAATLPNYDITPKLPEIFADMKQAGLAGVELMHNALRPNDAVAQIGELIKKHDLPVLGTSFSGALWDRTKHQEIMDDAQLVIANLAKLGGRTLGMSVGQAPQKKTEAQLDAQAELLKKIIAFGEKHGVTLNLHNHTYEVVDNLHDLKGTLARLPDTRLGPDLNWLVRGGVDPVAFIRQYGKQIVFLHLRDQHANGRWSEALGEGDMDYAAIARALREINFQGHAIIELAHERDFQPTRPLRESLRLSRAFVQRVLGY